MLRFLPMFEGTVGEPKDSMAAINHCTHGGYGWCPSEFPESSKSLGHCWVCGLTFRVNCNRNHPNPITAAVTNNNTLSRSGRFR